MSAVLGGRLPISGRSGHFCMQTGQRYSPPPVRMTVSFSKELYFTVFWVSFFPGGARAACPVWKGDFGVGSSVGAALAEHSYYRGIVRDEDIARSSCSRRSEAVARPCGRSTGAQDVFAERKESGCWSWRRKDVREHDVAGNVDDVNVSNSASLAFSDIVPT